ncbi:MAG: hypothetical protein CYG60_01550 [Actinobacteria bacterium]|jgi:hypothetical protein|nr:MAG: hypothetical protein CYG60_01550 [Actinomycetota bacterium]
MNARRRTKKQKDVAPVLLRNPGGGDPRNASADRKLLPYGYLERAIAPRRGMVGPGPERADRLALDPTFASLRTPEEYVRGHKSEGTDDGACDSSQGCSVFGGWRREGSYPA